MKYLKILKENKFTSLELTFILFIPLITVLFSKALFVQLQSVTVFLGCLLVITKYGWKRDNSIMSSFLLFLFFYGTIIGAFYLVFGNNDAYKMIQYSFLALSAYIGFKTGFKIAQKNNLFYFIFIFLLVDLLLFYALFFNGNKGRTSIGTSNLFPVLLIIFLNLESILSRKFKFLITFLLLTAVLAGLISGMRSSLGTIAISCGIVFIYKFQFLKSFKFLKYSIICTLFISICGFFIPDNIKSSVYVSVESIIYRFEKTLFNQDGIQLDSSSSNGGRKLEAESAIQEFNKNTGLHTFIGYGHGFIYFDQMQEKVKAHIHITYIAYYVRYGLLGISFLTFFFLSSIFHLAKYFFKPRDLINSIKFGLWLSVLQILIISLIAASLISIVHWVVIGLAFGFEYFINRKKTIHEVYNN